MVSKTFSDISKVWGLISGVFLLLVALFPDEIRKWIISVFGVPSEVFVFIAIIVLLVLGIVASIVIIMINRHYDHERSKGENITMPTPSKKRRWLSKLRRPPIKKGKRADFWTTMIGMIIIGAVAIIIAFSFSSASLSQEAIFSFLVFKYTMLGSGILLIALSVWLMTSELYTILESRKQLVINHKTAYLSLIRDFNDVFKAVQEATEPKAKERMLDYLQPLLRSLCYDYPWNDVKNQIGKVLEFIIPKELSREPLVLNYLQYLAMIMNRYGEHTIDKIGEKWGQELQKLYDDPEYETNATILDMLQELHEYSEDYLMKLIDDSVQWNDERFQNLANRIAFWELKKRDEVAHRRVLQYLVRKMNEAAKNKEDKTFERFKFLHGTAMR